MLRRPIYERRRTSQRQALVLLTCFGLMTYFAVHAMSGKHGFEARSRLLVRSGKLEREVAGLEAVRARLKRDIALLSGIEPDPDIIGELASGMLGFAVPGDIIVQVPPTSR